MNDAVLSALGGALSTAVVALTGTWIKNVRERERNASDADGGLRKDTMLALREERQRVRELETDIEKCGAEYTRERAVHVATLLKCREDWFEEKASRLDAETRAAVAERAAALIEERRHRRE